MTDALPCQRCGAALPPSHRFCGMCGAPAGAAAPGPGAQRPDGGLRRYLGPALLGAFGAFVFVCGVMAAGTIASMQLDSIPELVVELGSPFLREQVEGSVVEGVVDIGGSAGHTWSVATGTFFVVSVVVALLGVVLMLSAGVWALSRRRRVGAAGATTVPALPQPTYQRPTFTKRRPR